MITFLISLLTAIAAGAITARIVVRRELELNAARMAAAAPAPVAQVIATPAPVVVAPPVEAAPPPAPVVAPPPQPAAPEEITPEILMVLSAAVAAFLGKRARIRSARLRSGMEPSSAWAQQGRVFVQASHNLPHHSGGRF